MQKLKMSPSEVQQVMDEENHHIETVEGAKHYFALVDYEGHPILCLYKAGRWTPTSQAELIELISR